MLTVDHISMEFSSRPVLDDITFLINRKERIALVGKNGAGKTTLLRLIAGEYEPTVGRIARESDMTIGYLPQVMLFQDDRTLREEVLTVFHGEDEARFIAEMDRTIIGLGFERKDFERPCSEFSGGWRMRIELAKILLRHPDLLLLDEPTNHLDIESIQWLEDFLKTNTSAVLMVSHDLMSATAPSRLLSDVSMTITSTTAGSSNCAKSATSSRFGRTRTSRR